MEFVNLGKRKSNNNDTCSRISSKKTKWNPPLKNEVKLSKKTEIDSNDCKYEIAETCVLDNGEQLQKSLESDEFIKQEPDFSTHVSENNFLGTLETNIFTVDGNNKVQCLQNSRCVSTIKCPEDSNNFEYCNTSLYNDNMLIGEDYQNNECNSKYNDIVPELGLYENEVKENYENSPINMYSAFMMSFGIEPARDVTVQNNVNVGNQVKYCPDDSTNLGIINPSEDSDMVIFELKTTHEKESEEPKNAFVENVKNNKFENTRGIRRKQKKRILSNNGDQEEKSEKGNLSNECLDKNTTDNEPYNIEIKMDIHKLNLQKEMQDLKPFTGNYKLADARNKLRFAYQQQAGEMEYYEYLLKNGYNKNKHKVGSKTYSAAATLCELAKSIIEALQTENESQIMNEMENFYCIAVTSLALQFVPHFLLLIKTTRGSDLYNDKVRKLAQKIYSSCRAMYGIPFGETFEFVLKTEMKKMYLAGFNDNTGVIYQLEGLLDETFETENESGFD